MARYRKKPVVIEAVQVAAAVYNGKTWNGSPFKCDVLPQWLEDAFTNGTIAVHPSDRDYALLAIKAPEGTMVAEPGDWIIRGVKGEGGYFFLLNAPTASTAHCSSGNLPVLSLE